jgi:excisionase family DNA binding protein
VLERLEVSAQTSRSPFLTVAEAADYLRGKRQRVYDLLSTGRLTRHKDGRRTLVSRAELDSHLAGEGQRRAAPAWPPPLETRSGKGLAA